MSEYADQLASSPFVASMTTRIDRHAAKYSEAVGQYFETPGGTRERDAEQHLLDDFNAHVEAVVAKYVPPGSRRQGDSLVFRHIYAAARKPDAEDEDARGVSTEFLAALLAAEVEFRGPLRLSRTQRTLLADVYERLGEFVASAGLPAHAALAFGRAGGLHRQNEDDDAEDRCGLAKARARTQAVQPPWHRIGRWISAVSCGYGYRPFRLLGWMGLQLVLFTTAITALTGRAFADAAYLCMTNYLNPAGLSEAKDLGAAAEILLIIEAYAGIVSTSVFFALLVRRWFRI
ncbi:hypothetical protein [Nocardia sp. NPDC050710]|uniref:hypothetical protein n=1 Tax=Nocardia sp. NPDC050710 TaxID=3157220 RepID=UPI003404526A